MRILHYYTYPENGGGPLSYVNNILLSKYLKRYEFSVCYQMKPLSAFRYADFKRIVEEIKAYEPDILHIHGLQSEGLVGLLAGKKAHVKTLMTVHGIQIDAQDIGILKKMLFKTIIEPYELKRADAVYCVCQAMRNRKFIQKNTKKLLPVLYNFVPDRFLESTKDSSGAIEVNEKVIISMVGRVVWDKGLKEFEYCVKRDHRAETQYWLIGDGICLSEVKKRLKPEIDCRKVILWGQQKNVKQLLERTDIFFFPSYHENLSIALLEAAACKCCCVVTNVGGNAEVIRDRIEGVIIPAQNPQCAKESLDMLIENRQMRKKYSDAAYKRVATVFSEKQFAKNLSKIYDDLLERGRLE